MIFFIHYFTPTLVDLIGHQMKVYIFIGFLSVNVQIFCKYAYLKLSDSVTGIGSFEICTTRLRLLRTRKDSKSNLTLEIYMWDLYYMQSMSNVLVVFRKQLARRSVLPVQINCTIYFYSFTYIGTAYYIEIKNLYIAIPWRYCLHVGFQTTEIKL